jgi:drug/metabolite transporter (DMT)-like permease
LIQWREIIAITELKNISQNSATINYILLFSLVLIWGTSFLLINRSLLSFIPEQVVLIRLWIAAIVMLFVLLIKNRRLPLGIVSWFHFSLLSVIGNILPFWLIAVGQTTISSGLAGLLMAVMPLFTIVLAHLFLKDDKINRYKMAGFVIGFSGVGFILAPTIASFPESTLSVLLVLIASLCYAVNTVITKIIRQYDPIVVSSGVLISSSVIASLIWPQSLISIEISSASTVSLISVLLLGVLPTGLAALIYFNIINRTGPTFLSNINYLIPVVAYFLGALVLNEVVLWHDLLALLLIIFGIFISRKKVPSIKV